jgi:Phage portal protein, SPP1 Gp6-like
LNRYALNWALYLGHHWSHQREAGEHQYTANFYRAFTDFVNRFSFGKGVHFHTPEATSAILPDLLQRVWEKDNTKEAVLMEMGQQGGVSGDCFVKVAYEEPYVDSAGITNAGRCRILPMNAAHCLGQNTEILTRRGWLGMDDVRPGDQALALDPNTDELVWSDVHGIVKRKLGPDEKAYHWHSERFDAISTSGHRWLYEGGRGKRTVRTTDELHGLRSGGGGRLVVAGGTPTHFPTEAKYTDEFVELIGWVTAEGTLEPSSAGFVLCQNPEKNPAFAARIDRLHKHYEQTYSYIREETGTKNWRFDARVGHEVRAVIGEHKAPLVEFLTSLTMNQATLLYNTLMDGDGDTRRSRGEFLWQNNWAVLDAFQMLAMMLGKRSNARMSSRSRSYDGQTTMSGSATVYQNRTHNLADLKREEIDYDGYVWCPVTDATTWVARSHGTVFHTGNCFPEWHPHDRTRLLRMKIKYRFWGTSLEGTRQVFTYTEILTDDIIEEYLNDELIDSRPNPIGVVPVVHIANLPVSGSPWGLPDCQDIISLNRQYNEIATAVSDIINYHAEPITIITGAKASQLERGAKKIWAGLPKDARVENLEGGYQGLQQGIAYLEILKRTMHEMVGVPETALGQVQPISNTSGVALSIQFQPLMNRWQQKVVQYGMGIQKINELVIRTLALKEPEMLVWSEGVNSPLESDNLPELDPRDPLTYYTEVEFPPPLPLDKLVMLNEIQQKFLLGLESREGALRLLGEEFPDEKLIEIREEQIQDALADGALGLIKTQIQNVIVEMTGMMTGPDGSPIPAPPPEPVDVTGDAIPDTMMGMGVPPTTPEGQQMDAQIRNQLVTMAYGTRLPQRSVAKPDA